MKKTTPIQQRLFATNADLIVNPATINDAIFQHSVLCQTFLPYRNPGDDLTKWEQQQGNVTLAIQTMEAFNPETRQLEKVGLPYGTKARLILAHINSQAIRTQTPTINMESSLTAFVNALNLNTEGYTIGQTKEQLRRLASAVISLGYFSPEKNYQVNLQIAKGFDFMDKNDNKRVLWTNEITLTEDYFNSLMVHAIPLDERALAALAHNAMALDIYAWLAQRLHRIQDRQFVSWSNLKDQFGNGYKDMKKFKEVFRKTLLMVRTQYPTARIDEDENKGFTLKTSPTPVQPKTTVLLR